MHVYQQREIWILCVLLLGSLIVGAIFGLALWFFIIAMLGYTLYSLINSFKLHNWLLNNKQDSLPEASGLWGELFHQIYLMDKETGSNRAQLSNILKRFQDAATVLPDGMIILTKRYRIQWSNNAASRLLGINHPRDEGQAISNLIRHPKFKIYLNKNDFQKSIVLPSPVKPDTVFSLQIIPFGSNQKLIICRDVSHVMRLEVLRSSFVANVSHELRTPITVLSGYLETLHGMKLDNVEAVKSTFYIMQEQANRMERLVADLLVLSKLETQPVDHLNNNVSVPNMLKTFVESASLLSGDKHHKIIFHIDTKLHFLGNKEELQSLFQNLINNAIRYTPVEGHIDIYWEATKEDVIFMVADSGPGIAPQHIPHLTERFYRVDADRSRQSGGTGLGLAIVKHIIERHDGTLDIESELEQGSVFRCHFPIERILWEE